MTFSSIPIFRGEPPQNQEDSG